MEKINIIIPYYNGHLFIDDLLHSIEKQSCRDFIEIIIVNDGSESKSTDFLEKCIKNKKNLNINYVFQENQGISAARNTGLKMSASKYISFIDQDDMLCGRYSVEYRIDYLEGHPDVDIVGGYAIKIDTKGNVVHTRAPAIVENTIREICKDQSKFPKEYLNYYLKRQKVFFFITGSAILQRNSLEGIAFQSKFDKVEDIRLTIDLLANRKKIHFLKIPFYFKRSHQDQAHIDTSLELEKNLRKLIINTKKNLGITL